jgi:hypothetical protein
VGHFVCDDVVRQAGEDSAVRQVAAFGSLGIEEAEVELAEAGVVKGVLPSKGMWADA